MFLISRQWCDEYTVECLVDGDRETAKAVAARMNELERHINYDVDEYPIITSPDEVTRVTLHTASSSGRHTDIEVKAHPYWQWDAPSINGTEVRAVGWQITATSLDPDEAVQAVTLMRDEIAADG